MSNILKKWEAERQQEKICGKIRKYIVLTMCPFKYQYVVLYIMEVF